VLFEWVYTALLKDHEYEQHWLVIIKTIRGILLGLRISNEPKRLVFPYYGLLTVMRYQAAEQLHH
jgi:hypothetical protein